VDRSSRTYTTVTSTPNRTRRSSNRAPGISPFIRLFSASRSCFAGSLVSEGEFAVPETGVPISNSSAALCSSTPIPSVSPSLPFCVSWESVLTLGSLTLSLLKAPHLLPRRNCCPGRLNQSRNAAFFGPSLCLSLQATAASGTRKTRFSGQKLRFFSGASERRSIKMCMACEV
jgi:hypothetical protein